MTTAAVYAVALALTCARKLLVLDAVSSVSRVTRAMQVMSSRTRAESRGITRGMTSGSPRQRTPAGAGCSKIRTLHKWLLMMHLIAVVHASAGCFKYMLSASDALCRVTTRALVTAALLYDASLVSFLLEKASVTNGDRTLAAWEKIITWCSRFYAWGYLPTVAVLIAVSLPGVANEEGTFCLAGSTAEGEATTMQDLMGFVTNNMMLVIQFALLMAVFVKPIMISQGSTQSGRAIYRRLVARKIVCTVAVVLGYTVTTGVVVLTVLDASAGSHQGRTGDVAVQIADMAPTINIVMTLCLTEERGRCRLTTEGDGSRDDEAANTSQSSKLHYEEVGRV